MGNSAITPSHYNNENFTCLDVMIRTHGVDATMNFCILNAFKYLYRHNNKNGLQDIEKAKWYIDKYIELAKQYFNPQIDEKEIR